MCISKTFIRNFNFRVVQTSPDSRFINLYLYRRIFLSKTGQTSPLPNCLTKINLDSRNWYQCGFVFKSVNSKRVFLSVLLTGTSPARKIMLSTQCPKVFVECWMDVLYSQFYSWRESVIPLSGKARLTGEMLYNLTFSYGPDLSPSQS